MTAADVAVTGVVRRFDGRGGIDGAHLRARGGVVSVLGPNGAGKTTLLRCLATVLVPSDGSVTVDGLDVRRPAERTEIRRRLGYLPQEPGLCGSSRVFDIVDYHAVLRGLEPERRRRVAVVEALEAVGLRHRMADRVTSLSGGMRRRVALAQALVGSPSLLVLDEPTAALDPDQRHIVRHLVTERAAATTVVLGTHLVDEAAAISDAVVVMDAGRVVAAGSPSELAARARGRVWVQAHRPTRPVRASWRQPDGYWRCVDPAPGSAEQPSWLVEPTLDDAYLLLVAAPVPS